MAVARIFAEMEMDTRSNLHSNYSVRNRGFLFNPICFASGEFPGWGGLVGLTLYLVLRIIRTRNLQFLTLFLFNFRRKRNSKIFGLGESDLRLVGKFGSIIIWHGIKSHRESNRPSLNHVEVTE